MADLSDILTRKYNNFRGVDFSEGEVNLSRSPDALNIWKSYKNGECIETRPGMIKLGDFNHKILGLFFFSKNGVTKVLVHAGTKLLSWDNYPNKPVQTTELFSGMNIVESQSFVFEEILFIKDGINYLEYDGLEIKKVVGTIPTTTYWKTPDGATNIDDGVDTDYVNQPVNCLTSLRRNVFIGDGVSNDYYLDDKNLDDILIYQTEATVDDINLVENIDFTVDREKGIVTFETVPRKDAQVKIVYSKTANGHKERVLNSTIMCEFDNRIFYSGNPNYPNVVFHSELYDPRYVRDTAYYECGIDYAKIKALIPGNGVLWVVKEIEQNSSSLYYLTPTLDSTYNKIYPSVSGSISLGCVSTGINFNDDIVFFSNRGLEGVANNSLYSEQLLQHRSTMVDRHMILENEYKDVKLAEYNGYLMCLIGSNIYLADSRKKFQSGANNIEYEWFYWQMPFDITFIKEYRQKLYFGNESGELFILDGADDNEQDVLSYWTTPKDDFGYPGYTKTTNKKGNVANLKILNNDEIHVDTIVDGVLREKAILSDKKGYIAYKVKDKKFKDIQLRFSSNKPFGLFSCTLQGFVAGYIKR